VVGLPAVIGMKRFAKGVAVERSLLSIKLIRVRDINRMLADNPVDFWETPAVLSNADTLSAFIGRSSHGNQALQSKGGNIGQFLRIQFRLIQREAPRECWKESPRDYPRQLLSARQRTTSANKPSRVR
jgi:hypothetical protein